jgi:citrate synthase
MIEYIPGLEKVPAAESSISYIDGEKGVLEYRGIRIEDLAAHSTFEETAYLLLNGKLPTEQELADLTQRLARARTLPKDLQAVVKAVPKSAHPMAALQTCVAAIGMVTKHQDIYDEKAREASAVDFIGKFPSLVTAIHRVRNNQEIIAPDPSLPIAADFLHMLTGDKPDTNKARAMDICLILHADHTMNASTFTTRVTASTECQPAAAISAAVGSLSGPLHGGANEAVLRMLKEIGSVDHIPAFIKKVKAGEGRLMGFGHRVYKSYDPRAKIIKKTAYEVFEVTGKNPLLDIALELERIALEDEYFISRKLYPNVDFYSGLIYQAMGFPVEMFAVLFAIARTVGWVAQWEEMLLDPDTKIARPKQLYEGANTRDYIPLSKR